MWPATKLTNALKITLPIIQAPMAGAFTPPSLIAHVSNAGGLGSLGAGYASPDEIRKTIASIRAQTDKPFAINLFIPEDPQIAARKMRAMEKILEKISGLEIRPISPPYTYSFDEQIAVLIEEKVPVFSFTFGIPTDKRIKQLKQKKIKLMGTATSIAEAQLLERKGIDMLVAQGAEGGGHRGVFLDNEHDACTGTMVLIPQISGAVSIPVIAAGGIMDGRGIVAALALGASGVAMGTAFFSCTDASTHEV